MTSQGTGGTGGEDLLAAFDAARQPTSSPRRRYRVVSPFVDRTADDPAGGTRPAEDQAANEQLGR